MKADPFQSLLQQKLTELQSSRAVLAGKVRQIAETAGHRVLVLDLSANNSPALSYRFDVDGYSVTVAKGGSDRIAVTLDLGSAGTFGPVYPGQTIRPKSRFSRITVRRWSSLTDPIGTTQMAAGCFVMGRYLSIVVGKTPDAEYSESSSENAGFHHYRLCTPAYNVTTNVPTSVRDGISVRGAQSILCGLVDAGNILTGSIVWWYNPSPTDGTAWGETEVQQNLIAGRTAWWGPELEIKMKTGRYFPELRSYTNAAGDNSIPVYLFAFGEGGELNAGDVQP